MSSCTREVRQTTLLVKGRLKPRKISLNRDSTVLRSNQPTIPKLADIFESLKFDAQSAGNLKPTYSCVWREPALSAKVFENKKLEIIMHCA